MHEDRHVVPVDQCAGEKTGSSWETRWSSVIASGLRNVGCVIGDVPERISMCEGSPLVVLVLFEKPMNSPPGVELWHPTHFPGVFEGVMTVTTLSSPTENPLSAEPPRWSSRRSSPAPRPARW